MRYLVALAFLLFIPRFADAQWTDNIDISGYFQGNPVFFTVDLPAPIGSENWMEYRLQNRLNLRWDISESVNFHWQMRTRAFFGDLVQDFPGYADQIDTDDGLVNLSWMAVSRDKWLLHYLPDRLYFQWAKGDWDIRVGRQRVNWGINMITNPNDLFNIYSFYEFDYRERPGSDAIRIQRHIGFGERIELAVSPARSLNESIFAALYGFDFRDYDVQVIGGYYRNRLTAGGGWAGNLGEAGFKGELMFYTDLQDRVGQRSSNLVGALSGDYIFSSGLFVIGEFLYNHDGGIDDLILVAERFRPDNPSLSRYQFTVQLSYPLNPLIDLVYANVYYPDEKAVFLSPGFNWSVIEDLDFQLIGQIFVGSSDSALSSAASLVTASLRYSY